MTRNERARRVDAVAISGVRVAIYVRISDDQKGEEAGVTRQAEKAREMIARHPNWVEVGVYPDNDISALHAVGRRKQYERLCRAVRRGEIDVIVCYHMSRFWRNREERAAGIEMLRDAHTSLWPVYGTELDMSTAMARSMAALLGEFDTMESELKGERIRDQKEQRAQTGKYSGSGARPFGYVLEFDRPQVNPDTGERQKRTLTAMYPHPEEAEIVQEMARRVLAGESIYSVTKDLNARGVRSTAGKKLRPDGVRRILSGAVLSGRRETLVGAAQLQRTGGGRPLGKIVADGNWKAIISAEESDRLRRMLTAPDRKPGRGPKTLLTGRLRCGMCRTPMTSRPHKGDPRYVCNLTPGADGCGKAMVRRGLTDVFVRDAIITRLNGPGMAERLARRRTVSADPDLKGRVQADEENLAQLNVDRYDPEIGMSHSEYVTTRKSIMARLSANRAKLDDSVSTSDGAAVVALAQFRGDARTDMSRAADMRQRWEALTDDQRRPLVDALLDHITVNRPTVPHGTRGFDWARFVFHWREWTSGAPDSPEDVDAEINIAS